MAIKMWLHFFLFQDFFPIVSHNDPANKQGKHTDFSVHSKPHRWLDGSPTAKLYSNSRHQQLSDYPNSPCIWMGVAAICPTIFLPATLILKLKYCM